MISTFKTFKSNLLNERFLNSISGTDGADEIRDKYAEQVWDVLQQSYKAIGGIKGSGLETVESMKASIPMWKIMVKNDKVRIAILYKDKAGRKLVAIGTDGSPEAKKELPRILKAEISRSFGEKSKSSLGATMKTIPWDVLKDYVKTPDEVKKLRPKDEITPVSSLKSSETPSDGQMTLKKYPMLRDYAYLREIGGPMVFKVLIGTTGKNIK